MTLLLLKEVQSANHECNCNSFNSQQAVGIVKCWAKRKGNRMYVDGSVSMSRPGCFYCVLTRTDKVPYITRTP